MAVLVGTCAVVVTIALVAMVVSLARTLEQVRKTAASVDLLAREVTGNAVLLREALQKASTLSDKVTTAVDAAGSLFRFPLLKMGNVAVAAWKGFQWVRGWRKKERNGGQNE